MEIGKQYLKDLPQRQYVKKKFNEFTPISSKATENDIIREFVVQKDVAAWFRGTSHYHIKGADKLLNALRDDGEQATTHRVRSCLNLIGLKPMITSKQIKFLMRLCRGNDLVFLWFLMENHYKTQNSKQGYFSQNEQLICSAICHLDMVTTLRELDKILPRGNRGCTKMETKCPKRQERKEPLPKQKQKNKTSAHQFVLPYFKKYNQPQYYGKPLILEQPNFRVNFKYYRDFNDPNYIVQNESNRWYANYNLNPGKRIVYSIIRDIIKNIVYNYEIVSLKVGSNEILCGYHKTLKSMQANLKHERIVKARDHCLKQCLTDKENHDKRVNKIKTGLNNAVHQQMSILSQQTKTSPDEYTLKTIGSDCKVYAVILGGSGGGDCNTTTGCCETSVKEKMYPNNCNENDKFQIAQNSMQCKCNIRFQPQEEQFNEDNNCVINNETQLMPSEAFFKRPCVHQPYKFDFNKILANTKNNKESDIRKIIMKTLNETNSNLSTENEDTHMIYDDVVNKFVQKTFQKELESYEATHVDGPTDQHSIKYPTSASYNTEDFQLMDQMLFEAFQHLRKNPKFVWAQLPDAHKLPFLREWFAHRFGKTYTPTERIKSYRRSCLVFRALERSYIKLSIPSASKMGKNFFVDYNCRQHVERKVEQLKRKYYRNLDAQLLEHTRIFWFAIRGYICSNGPPRKSFYAYMPSRLQDIQHVCLWKPSEYRNNWNSWNVRSNNRV